MHQKQASLEDHYFEAFGNTIPHILVLAIIVNMIEAKSIFSLFNPFKYIIRSFDVVFICYCVSMIIAVYNNYRNVIKKNTWRSQAFLNLMSVFMFIYTFGRSEYFFGFIKNPFTFKTNLVFLVYIFSSTICLVYNQNMYLNTKMYLNTGLIRTLRKEFNKIIKLSLNHIKNTFFVFNVIMLFSNLSSSSLKFDFFINVLSVEYEILCISFSLFFYFINTHLLITCFKYNYSITDERRIDNICVSELRENRFLMHHIIDLTRRRYYRKELLKSKIAVQFLKESLKREMDEIQDICIKLEEKINLIEKKKYHIFPVFIKQEIDEDENKEPLPMKKVRSYNFKAIISAQIVCWLMYVKQHGKLIDHLQWVNQGLQYINSMILMDDAFGLYSDFYANINFKIDETNEHLKKISDLFGKTKLAIKGRYSK